MTEKVTKRSSLAKAITGGEVICQIHNETVTVLSCRATEGRVVIPDMIAGKPVTEIAKKAMLSDKILQELVLPAELETVGDWAFAHCRKLTAVWMERKEIHFGKGAFKDCGRLQYLYLKGEENPQVAGLLAATPVALEAEYLLSPLEAGEEEWLKKLDARLLALLEKPDEEGYSKQVLCGEEDLMASLDIYLADRRKQKAELCYLRLLQDTGLSEAFRVYLEGWLRSHTKGCMSQASWEVILENHTENAAYYNMFAKAGCITEENFEEFLADLGESHPERKAWFFKYKEEHMEQKDFFDSFTF